MNLIIAVVLITGLIVITKLFEFVCNKINLKLTSPFGKPCYATHTIINHVKSELRGYVYNENGWYKLMNCKKSWDEAKIAEPVATLLTLITKDFDNFLVDTSEILGDPYLINLQHNSLDIKMTGGDKNICVLFGNDIKFTKDETQAVADLIYSLQEHKRLKLEGAEELRCKRIRANTYIDIVNKINNCLINKEITNGNC